MRCDAVYVDDVDSREIVKAKQLAYLEITVESKQNSAADAQAEQDIELLAEAGWYLTEINNATIGLLQRHFRISLNQAAAIMNELCRRGSASNSEGTKSRKILMSGEELKRYVKRA